MVSIRYYWRKYKEVIGLAWYRLRKKFGLVKPPDDSFYIHPPYHFNCRSVVDAGVELALPVWGSKSEEEIRADIQLMIDRVSGEFIGLASPGIKTGMATTAFSVMPEKKINALEYLEIE